MKKVLIAIALVLLVLFTGGVVFKEPLMAWLGDAVTRDMFVSQDADTYDPGLAVGATFPAIHASFQGGDIYDVDQFIADRGLVFIAVRSADW